MNMNDLTDTEIRQQLIALFQSVGPVIPSTRVLHLKKLRNLLAQGDAPMHEHALPTMTNGNIMPHDVMNGNEEAKTTLENERSSNQCPLNNGVSEPCDAPRKASPPRSTTPLAGDDSSDEELRGEKSVRYLSPEEMELEMAYNRSCNSSYKAPNNDFRKVSTGIAMLNMNCSIFSGFFMYNIFYDVDLKIPSTHY
ncbi:hypothetical protein KIN20_014579 [Parelaphostrongylus tenuis]|uniref:LEM domain-containing protein n=1 Tax=Parelaphostrongylus tenuis TaxID=148309 RepID=A0AAD5QS03_PARTN|nr:hypothetical protein KIN20_014579 [Parelaphostrongylus tenuis]